MLIFHQIETFLHHTPPHLQEIVLELSNIIFSVASDATEVVRWGGLSYFHAERGGIVSAGICQIGIHKEHVRLAFIHGAFYPTRVNSLVVLKNTSDLSKSIPMTMFRGMI
ncbi:MAG: DUF1801 domain-containing protein [Anaerolineaceae bacterium]|nr:MAG: DUF1801 domain-containing protein [Anaerolineaceae bacterium]